MIFVRGQAGDTIIEVMVALSVLSFSLAMSYKTADGGLSASLVAEQHSQALGILDSQVEELRLAMDNDPSAVLSLAKNGSNFFCITSSGSLSAAFIKPVPTSAEADQLGGYQEYNSGCAQQGPPYYVSINEANAAGTVYNGLYSTPFPSSCRSGCKEESFTFMVRWDAAGEATPQQESMTYRLGSPDIAAGYKDPAIVASSVSCPCAIPSSKLTYPNWKLIFDDEFNGTTLDTSKWNSVWSSSSDPNGPVNNNEADCYDPNQVTVGNYHKENALRLQLIQKTNFCKGKSEPFTTGIVTTAGKFSYQVDTNTTYAEARIWMPTDAANPISGWPAFWQIGSSLSYPFGGELDTVEGLHPNSLCGHWHGPPNGGGVGWTNDGTNFQGCASSAPYVGGWHTYAVEFQPGLITWYYDCQKMGTLTAAQASSLGNNFVSAYQYLVLDLAVFKGYQNNIIPPLNMYVDYVRVWQET